MAATKVSPVIKLDTVGEVVTDTIEVRMIMAKTKAAGGLFTLKDRAGNEILQLDVAAVDSQSEPIEFGPDVFLNGVEMDVAPAGGLVYLWRK